MRLVLQCAMCGTHHPVGTEVCSTCRASGITQLRLMFECETCRQLDIKPTCDACAEGLALAEEIEEEQYVLVGGDEPEDIFEFDFKEGEEDATTDEAVYVLDDEDLDGDIVDGEPVSDDKHKAEDS